MSLIQSILDFVPQLAGLGPATLALLGAFVLTMTALQGLALAAQGLFAVASKIFMPVPGVSAFFGTVAHALGTVALDLQKFGALASKAITFLGRFVKPAATIAKSGLVLLLCTSCSAPFVFSNPSTQTVTCEITAAVLPLLEELSATLGFPLSVVESLYSAACAEAAAKGMSQHDAEQYGVHHARALGMKMRAELAK